ncbi:hypothetical protein [Spartinivicinus ruber]|uniref:hypothetical protein n=1 Tax=Spartinivicinus ruber TaxID=2683272 RepID=UPI0013D7DC90|nr:hypothetical protein [Spartinivicinus ruber]
MGLLKTVSICFVGIPLLASVYGEMSKPKTPEEIAKQAAIKKMEAQLAADKKKREQFKLNNPQIALMQDLRKELDFLRKNSRTKISKNIDLTNLKIVLAATYSQAELALQLDNHLEKLNTEERKLLSEYKQRLVTDQKYLFPQLRDKLGPVLRKKLWRQNISVKTIKSGYRYIQFSGSLFASNAAVEDTHIAMYDMLCKMRFKKANYQWSEHADSWVYTLNSYNDGALVTMYQAASCRA